MEWLRWEGTSGNHLLQPLSKQGQAQQDAQGHVQSASEYLQEQRLHNLSGQPVPVFDHLHSELHFLMYKWIFLYFNLCSCLFITSLGTTGKSLAPSSLLPIRHLYTLSRKVTSYRLGSSHQLISLLLTADFSSCAQHQNYYC